MTGEVQFIKKQMFGGFNREDVVAYVAKIAQERNEARDANAEAQEKIEVLVSEVSDLIVELETCKKIISEMEMQNKPSFLEDPLRKKDVPNEAGDAGALDPETLLEKLSQDETENNAVAKRRNLQAEMERYNLLQGNIAKEKPVEEPVEERTNNAAAKRRDLQAEMERYNSLQGNITKEKPAEEETIVEEETAKDTIGDEIPEFHFNPDWYRLNKEGSGVSEDTNEVRFLDNSVQESFNSEPVVEGSVSEEPAVEEVIIEEPIIEEPIAEKPIAEKPVAEESELKAEVERYRAMRLNDAINQTLEIGNVKDYDYDNEDDFRGPYKILIKRK